ncbi:UNVERIFIED_CONTAM: toxoplasma gondii family A protein [Hammondia hammondi]|eukprot:XP_008887101.1 toxoplasma gondii family A protein [Hammondia hammondi]
MEGQTLRTVCLTLMIGTFLSCAAIQTKTSTTAVDFTVTIPKEGLEKNVEQVFNLGPSGTLRVTDETAEAVYQPESNSTDETLTDPYGSAYRFENGACDFTKTLSFKEVFPGYTKPLWVHEVSGSVETDKDSSGRTVTYTLANPPAQYLGESLSFCVRFKTVLATGSNSSTDSPTTPPATQDSGGTTPEGNPSPEIHDTPGLPPHPDPDRPPTSEGNSDPDNEQEEPQTENDGAEDKEEDEEQQLIRDGSLGVGSNGSVVQPPSTPSNSQTGETRNSDPAPVTTPAPKPGTESQHLGSNDVEGSGEAQLRRLSATPAETNAFLTIVVHSASCGFAGGMRALPVLLLSVATALLRICKFSKFQVLPEMNTIGALKVADVACRKLSNTWRWTTEEESPQEQVPNQGPVSGSSPRGGSEGPSGEVGQQLPSVGQGEKEEGNSDVGTSSPTPSVGAGGRAVPPFQGNHQLITQIKIKTLLLFSTLRVVSQKKTGGLTRMKAMKVKTPFKNPAAPKWGGWIHQV